MDTAETDTDLLAHALLPVAHEEDARVTAERFEPYDPDRVTVLHVVEQVGGETSDSDCCESLPLHQAVSG